MNHLSKYPVIRLNFKDVKPDSYENFLEHLKILSSEAYYTYKDELLETKNQEKKIYEKILYRDASAIEVNFSLNRLTQFLCKKYNQRVIVLIDEYDTPIDSCNEGDRNKIRKAMQSYLNTFLKDNENLMFSVITGTLGLDRSGIFYSIPFKFYGFNTRTFSTCFGFLEEEITENLSDLQSEVVSSIKHWYGGYQIFDKILFNPWSVINFYTRKKIENICFFSSYWIDNIETEQILLLLKENQDLKSDFLELLNNEADKKIIKEIVEPAGTKNIYSDSKGFWSFLFFNGYLSGQLKRNGSMECTLKIPNRELHDFFKKHL